MSTIFYSSAPFWSSPPIDGLLPNMKSGPMKRMAQATQKMIAMARRVSESVIGDPPSYPPAAIVRQGRVGVNGGALPDPADPQPANGHREYQMFFTRAGHCLSATADDN